MSNETQYLKLVRDVLDNGMDRPDRTGVGTRGVFGRQVRYDLREGFPLLTTKKMEIKSVLSELLWFLEGSADERRLAEIRFGKSRDDLATKKTIWTENRDAPYWKDRATYEGDLGRIYGTNWRAWRSQHPYGSPEQLDHYLDLGMTFVPTGYQQGVALRETDQIAELITGLKTNPFGRRHILNAWNAGEIDQAALPPCHVLCQFHIEEDRLSCLLYQRSADVALGVPYNIASYALLTHMLAQVCGYRVGEFVHTMGDCHIYHNHIDGVTEQLSRTPKATPNLYIDPTIKEIDGFSMDDFEIMGYESHPAIKLPMAV